MSNAWMVNSATYLCFRKQKKTGIFATIFFSSQHKKKEVMYFKV